MEVDSSSWRPNMNQGGLMIETQETSSSRRSNMSQGGHTLENQERNSDEGASILKWQAIFLVLCGIGVQCVDPLFLYLPVINQEDKCLMLDRRLMITAICLRSVADVIYVGNIIFGYFNRRRADKKPLEIVKMYLRKYLAIDILALLPIPQVLVPIIVSKMTSSEFFQIRKFLNACLLLQYVPRVLRIYLSWATHIESSEEQISTHIEEQISTHIKSTKGQIAKRTWIIKVAFYIFLYIHASNVIGGLWYLFSIQRETACWYKACEKHIRCTQSSFKCGRNSGNYTFLDDACPVQTPNTTLIDFGIFLEALQSGIVSSTDILQKLMHCFWWGFRNLSSFGSNLQTSTYFWENCFAVFISIYGLLIFLFFIGNAQTYLQMAAEKRKEIRRKMEPIRLKIESWMTRNNLPCNMKEHIINCIQRRLDENKDFDTEKVISNLSEDLITKIKHHLCLSRLKEVVDTLENQGDQNLLERICDSLKLEHYKEKFCILKKGDPVTAMVFTTQGSVCCSKTSNDENCDSADDHESIDTFELYGEELLQWLNHYPSDKQWLPCSTKTVKTHSKVEAFVLTAKDLKHLVPRHTRVAEATKGFVHGVFRHNLSKEKNNKNLSQNG